MISGFIIDLDRYSNSVNNSNLWNTIALTSFSNMESTFDNIRITVEYYPRYELHLYTMGNKLYASEMAKLLDPKGSLFAGRVISRGDDGNISNGDERVPKSKDLEGVLGMESSVVIIDDSSRVWPHNQPNLIVVER